MEKFEYEKDGLSEWEGWDNSNDPWSQSHHQDAVCYAVFGPTWSMEDAYLLIQFINKAWGKETTNEGENT